MINLIPPEARKRVQKEYWLRAVSVWMILAATAFVMIIALKVPVLVLVNSQLDAFRESYAIAATDDIEFKQSEDLILEANKVSDFLSNDVSDRLFSEVIEKIVSLSGSEISISSYTLNRKENIITEVIITGEATTRLALANFKEQIEADEYFAEAKLPLSNLAKDKEIPFNISITPQKISE